MRIAVLSGKGGAGKTFITVNLAAVAPRASYIDCDVEEPNGHLFFKPEAIEEEIVSVKIPLVDDKKCKGCRRCVNFCKFNALAYVQNNWMIFEEVCHSCGGCLLVCPEQALTEKDRPIGKIQRGFSKDISVHTGILDVGEVSGIPIIDRLLDVENFSIGQNIFIDCPPGSACSVMESIKDADYCILVAEPTVFGVHNLDMVYQLVSLFDKPFGIVINKYLDKDNPAERFSLDKKIKVLGRIPYDGRLAGLNAKGKIAVYQDSHYQEMFSSLLDKLMEEVDREKTVGS